MSIELIPADVIKDTADAWERARERARLKHQYLASLLHTSSAHLSNQIAGREHLSTYRTVALRAHADGLHFAQLFWDEVGGLLGIANRDPMAREVARCREVFMAKIDELQVRMAKADLAEREQKKEIA